MCLPLSLQGVAIPGLGVFTFSQKKIDVGSNKFIVIQRPVFVLSEKFAQTHSLHITKQHTAGTVSHSLHFNMSVELTECLDTKYYVEGNGRYGKTF